MNFKASLLTLATALFSASAIAGTVSNATVLNIKAKPGTGFHYIQMSTGISGTPGCNTTARWGMSVSTDGDRAALALLQMAAVTGKLVSITGTGACSSPNPTDAESISEFTVTM